MEAIVDSFPSIREERPVDTPVGRERAAFFGVRRDDRRDMLQCWYNAMIHIMGWCHGMAPEHFLRGESARRNIWY